MSEMKPFQANITGPGYGYVYVMSYPHSDKVKIGHSLNPTTRAAEIGGTLAPEQPVVEAYYWCSERREDVERTAHVLENHHRHNGEWFVLSITEAMAAINQAAGEVGVEIQLVFDRAEHEATMKRKQEDERRRLERMSFEELSAEYDKLQLDSWTNCTSPAMREAWRRGAHPLQVRNATLVEVMHQRQGEREEAQRLKAVQDQMLADARAFFEAKERQEAARKQFQAKPSFRVGRAIGKLLGKRK